MMCDHETQPSINVKTATDTTGLLRNPRLGRLTGCRWVTLLTAFVLCLSLGSCDRQSTLPDSVRSLTFKTLTGDAIGLTELSGPVLINFWATDCGVCLREMPDMARLYERYQPAGFELIAVAMPYDPPNRVLEMSEREQWPFPVALDINSDVLNAFASVKGTPTSYLLDRHARLIKRYVGAIPMDDLQEQLDSLLGPERKQT